MSSIILLPRGQCIQVIDNLQLCQCPSFASTLDQYICGRCGRGIHAHRDYVSMFVHHCPAMNCSAYYPRMRRVQTCTCSASLIEHTPVVNVYRSLPLPYETGTHPFSANTFTGDTANILFTPLPMPAVSTNDAPSYSVNVHCSPAALPYGADTLPSNVTTFTGDATNIPFTPLPMPATSTNDAPSHSYDEIVAPTPQPIFQTVFMTQVDAHSHLEVENSHIVQYQNDNPSVIHNVQDSDVRFHEDYSSTYVPEHGTEGWAGHRST
ncbi:hypothetical protein EDD18DRAFT_1345606 [Armillaria luteobubalina]|uniref:Uncharacterized protein n=1 Tax=Armillaria luteobubalina TaxID=153913 RepID=A0AA39QJ32_9AGAR|nr:hypothetical protein EDD18DRAFT_1345606 [Armillaria luteobubalina]